MDNLKGDVANTIAEIAKEVQCINNSIQQNKELIEKAEASIRKSIDAKEKNIELLLREVDNLKL